ncbi:MAG: S41 family peptidase [Cyclobacteriaceae bacterium]
MWNFEVHSDSIAVLTLNSFGLMGWKAMTIDYKAFLADAFQQIDELRIQHLIIDIRENNGGNDEMADELFSYLAEDSYNFNREGRTRYVKFPETLKSYIQTWGDNPWYFKLKPKGKKTDDGYYIFKENLTQSARNSDKKIYQGKSYLLTSSAKTSLAFYTAYRFKYQQLGTIVGQETGGNLNDINGGQILFLRLPNSGIEIDFPVMGGFSTQKQPNSGVRPDIEVEYTVQDITEERDLEMEEVLKILDK